MCDFSSGVLNGESQTAVMISWAEKQSQLQMSVTKPWTDLSSTHTRVVKLEAADEQTTSSSVMLTAGLKLTSSVDPERDTAVSLRQMRSFEAVFVLEAAVRSFFGRRGSGGDIGDTAVWY